MFKATEIQMFYNYHIVPAM